VTFVAIAQLVVIAVLVWVLRSERASASDQLDRVLIRHGEENHIMANRIQRPEVVPITPSRPGDPPAEPRLPKDIGELAKVGTISNQRPEHA
jgi:hypothetical protein